MCDSISNGCFEVWSQVFFSRAAIFTKSHLIVLDPFYVSKDPKDLFMKAFLKVNQQFSKQKIWSKSMGDDQWKKLLETPIFWLLSQFA